jgi:hypothetical protein
MILIFAFRIQEVILPDKERREVAKDVNGKVSDEFV